MENLNFRAWDKFDKTMKEVFNLNFHRYTAVVRFRLSEPKSFLGNDPLIIMQSTGLKDKHGVEIFEGDVLEIPVAIDTETLNGEVVFEDGIFGIKDVLDGWGFDIGLVPLIEIILAKKVIIVGNIYEHPHLLEGDNE